ncbi:MAG: porin family protein [Lysobacteraceae bacterium]|nr:MAG: porin family protein [Xanthomonadaceae bacterium]
MLDSAMQEVRRHELMPAPVIRQQAVFSTEGKRRVRGVIGIHQSHHHQHEHHDIRRDHRVHRPRVFLDVILVVPRQQPEHVTSGQFGHRPSIDGIITTLTRWPGHALGSRTYLKIPSGRKAQCLRLDSSYLYDSPFRGQHGCTRRLQPAQSSSGAGTAHLPACSRPLINRLPARNRFTHDSIGTVACPWLFPRSRNQAGIGPQQPPPCGCVRRAIRSAPARFRHALSIVFPSITEVLAMFKRIPIFLAASLLSTGAMAADGWTGWHVGGTLGHNSGESDARVALGGQWSTETAALQNEVVNLWSTELEPSGNSYGIQFGYDHEFDGGFLLGAELDYSKLSADDGRLTGQIPTTPFPSLSYSVGNSVDINNTAALRARIGYGMDRHLVYLAAGWVRADADVSAEILSNGNYSKLGTASESLDGTQYGLGYAFDFDTHWSMRVEYLRNNLDDMKFTTAYRPGSSFQTPPYTETFTQDLDFDTIRVGVDYRF